MNCHRCQTNVTSRSAFCHLCGAQQKLGLQRFLPSLSIPSTGCIKCGASTPVQSVFCSQCGWFVKDDRYLEAGLSLLAEDKKGRQFLRPDLPRSIVDVTDYVEYFVHIMREISEDAGTESCLGAIDRFLEADLTQDQLEAVAQVSTDNIYLTVSGLTMVDGATCTYYETVVRKLMDRLLERGVRVCYVLDNELRDDRFQAVVDIFKRCGFLVVHPYVGETPVPEELVLGLFEQFIEQQRAHLVYIEKDASVNYLDAVRSLAREADPPLVGVFRCDAPVRASAFYAL